MHDSNAQKAMRRVADDYERLAIRFQPHEAKHATSSFPLTAADCRAHAQRCREMALHVGNFYNSQQLEQMAEDWDLLAADC
jgi:hypothetical protein